MLFNCINSVGTCGSLLVDLLFGDFLPARCFGWCLFSLVGLVAILGAVNIGLRAFLVCLPSVAAVTICY